MTRKRTPSPGAPAAFDFDYDPNFVPVPLRHREDGWTAMRQVAFIEALAQSGCVKAAAESVGMSVQSAYKLRQHFGASMFRTAWDKALDFAIHRLADAALSRAIHGVARPIVYQGQIIGERRYYDERLTQFLLRTRARDLYGRAVEKAECPPGTPEDDALPLSLASVILAQGDARKPRPEPEPAPKAEDRAKGGARRATYGWGDWD